MKNKSIAPADWGNRPFIEYVSEVDRLLYARYGITADDLDAVAAAQEAGESPQEHADGIVERFLSAPLPREGCARAARRIAV